MLDRAVLLTSLRRFGGIIPGRLRPRRACFRFTPRSQPARKSLVIQRLTSTVLPSVVPIEPLGHDWQDEGFIALSPPLPPASLVLGEASKLGALLEQPKTKVARANTYAWGFISRRLAPTLGGGS